MQQTSPAISLVTPHAGMFDAWFRLYEQYATAAGATPTRHSGGVLWRWLLDGTYRVAGIIALDARKQVVGFAHYHPYPKTVDGTEACRIDDLYVSAEQRESGLLERLIEHVCATARKRAWSDVTWTAAGLGDAPEFARLATRIDTAVYSISIR